MKPLIASRRLGSSIGSEYWILIKLFGGAAWSAHFLVLTNAMEIDIPQISPSVDPANPPNHKAFLIGINYSSSEEEESGDIGSEDDRPSPLVGPVNDVKEVKKMLMGAAR